MAQKRPKKKARFGPPWVSDTGRAASLLGRLDAFFKQTHGRRFLIETLAVRALLYDAQGEEDPAREALGRSIRLALPSNFIRLFVDLGPALARLLHGLEVDEEGQQYLERIRSAFRKILGAPKLSSEL